MRKAVLPALLPLLLLLPAPADEKPAFEPKIAPASDEGEKAIARFKTAPGLKVSLFAAEPLLANPVAFCLDEQGRVYVAEGFRTNDGVGDNRGRGDAWLDDDLASRTVADRVALYRKRLGKKFADWERQHDRVRQIVDTDGDGKADRSTVFADGFHKAEEGIGAGLLARKGNVYYTCIPHLWLLCDTKGTGKADVRRSLADGFGVHVAFFGHDLHGLRMGPDGRLYFSCGDRGLNVKTAEGKHLFYPDTGAVLRCDPDGSNLEVFATGLRNPQELAFDDHGNLFTVDNNSDAGDRARLVHVVEGGDSGWRVGYQYGSEMHDDRLGAGNRGPWTFEKLWHLRHDGQPAYIVPPLAHFTDGPSGLTHYPGVGLPERYRNHFFVCDFRGDPATSGVRAFTVRPKGASFELAKHEQFVWHVLATDCEFGPDGAFYVLDWTQGWNKPDKGRIYRVADPEAMKAPAAAEAKKLIAEGFDQRPGKELAGLLAHPHQQVRLEAQYALAGKGQGVVSLLEQTARHGKDRLARLHAIWGLGMIGRKDREPVAPVLLKLLDDADAEVRAQAVKTLGDVKVGLHQVLTVALSLKDAEPRVRFFAALSLARPFAPAPPEWSPHNPADYVKAVQAMVKEVGDLDPYLRHAGAMALAHLARGFFDGHLPLTGDESVPEALAAVVALRRVGSEQLVYFLGHPSPLVVAEAARAIHDEPVAKALPDLAALVANVRLPDSVLYRALNTHFRTGKAENARAVARFAARADAPAPLRAEALRMLGDWARPGRRDRVTGLTQELGQRPASLVQAEVRPVLEALFAGPDAVRRTAAAMTARLAIREAIPTLRSLARDGKQPGATRVEALRGLESLGDDQLADDGERAMTANDPLVRIEGRRLLAKADPVRAVAKLAAVLDDDRADLRERQGALAVLATVKGEPAAKVLGTWFDRLVAGKAPSPLRLDVLEAARASAALKDRAARFMAERPGDDPLAPYRETLEGGDAERGRSLFVSRAELSCLRCHKIGREGGEVGPDLAGIGSKQNRQYLLESLIVPSKDIAKGFETTVVALKSGKTVAGIVRAEDREALKLMTPEGTLVTVARSEIDDRATGKSAMPEGLTRHLSARDVRDLVEFLAGLKEPGKK